MRNKTTLYITLITFIVGAVMAMALIIATPFVIKANAEIVESYDTVVDEIAIDFDDDKLEYDVCVGNADKGTLKHYFVKIEDVVVIPYNENEAYIEIAKSGKCKLYFFIKWEEE